MSATLKINQGTMSMKSVTCPSITRSMRFPAEPASSSPTGTARSPSCFRPPRIAPPWGNLHRGRQDAIQPD